MSKRSRRRTPAARFETWAPAGDQAMNDRPDTNLAGGDHFATRTRANDFTRLMRSLPDPDPVLKKMGRGVVALRELLTDSHLESVWSIRCSAASGAEWFVSAGGEGSREQQAADGFGRQLASLDVPRVIEEMMDAVAFGYSPLEVLWTAGGGRWNVGNIVGKPSEWFEFDQANRLVLRTGAVATEELPENRFLLVRHRPSYANPYGDKVFSKCFWPVTFKRNGFRWWTVFVERYGGAFLYGKYPPNADETYKAELLTALERMVADAVAIAPEGSEISIETAANKTTSSNVHGQYIAAANAEISKAVLGQTLTTEIGDRGSYAAAQAHNLVREDLAQADRRRVASAFTRLAAVWSWYNFGSDVAAPTFAFVKDEDLQAERAERDKTLYAIGWRPRKRYIAREYGIPEDDFDLASATSADFASRRSAVIPDREHPESCSCADHDMTPPPAGASRQGVFARLASLFTATKKERERERDNRLIEEFGASMMRSAQEDTDDALDAMVDTTSTAATFEDAREALMAAYDRHDATRTATLVNEVRYAAGQIGARNA